MMRKPGKLWVQQVLTQLFPTPVTNKLDFHVDVDVNFFVGHHVGHLVYLNVGHHVQLHVGNFYLLFVGHHVIWISSKLPKI